MIYRFLRKRFVGVQSLCGGILCERTLFADRNVRTSHMRLEVGSSPAYSVCGTTSDAAIAQSKRETGPDVSSILSGHAVMPFSHSRIDLPVCADEVPE